jgi:hypothetical protein
MINYSDHDHTYYNEKKVIYDSPTLILKGLKQPFDSKAIAKAYAKKHGKTPSYWLKEWKKKKDTALDRGDKIHAEKEELSFGRGYEKVSGAIRPVFNGELYANRNLTDLPDGSYPELILYNNGWRIAGRADKVVIETIKGVRYVDIYDYKTNGRIDMLSYQDKSGKYKMMKAPVSHLMDTNFNHYSIQLSFYGYMLETHGFKVRNMQIIHIPHPIEVLGKSFQPPDQPYDMPYLKNEVLNILEKNNRKIRIYGREKTRL